MFINRKFFMYAIKISCVDGAICYSNTSKNILCRWISSGQVNHHCLPLQVVVAEHVVQQVEHYLLHRQLQAIRQITQNGQANRPNKQKLGLSLAYCSLFLPIWQGLLFQFLCHQNISPIVMMSRIVRMSLIWSKTGMVT